MHHPKRIAEITSLVIGSVALSTVILITVYESVARRVGVPFIGHQEATSLILAFIVWISIGYSEIKGGHINMSIILDHMSPSGRRIAEITFSFIMLVVSLVAVWPGVQKTIYDFNYHTMYTTLPWPTWIARAAVPAGLLAFATLQVSRISDLLRQREKPT
ncbi:MAG: TRAP transporter small permease [Chloroflexi bacterium]|nr:TRAP transporter small permease [Chloroflexota bacterium]